MRFVKGKHLPLIHVAGLVFLALTLAGCGPSVAETSPWAALANTIGTGLTVAVLGTGALLLLVIIIALSDAPTYTSLPAQDGTGAANGIEKAHMRLTPNCNWLSPSLSAPGKQMVVTITGTCKWYYHNRPNRLLDAAFTWTEGTRPASYRYHNALYFDESGAPARPFREDRLLHRYDFLYTGTGKQVGIFLEDTREQIGDILYDGNNTLFVSIEPLAAADEAFFRAQEEAQARQKAEQRHRRQAAAEAERRRQAEAADAKRREQAEALEAKRRNRFRTIQARYGDQLFAWRNDDAVLARFAKDHRYDLLSSSREQEIIDDYITFTNDDLDFAEWLRANHGDLYHRIDEVFFYRVRAIAESTPKDDTPRRPKLTPEERQAKFERYRQRGLERDRIQAEDRMAAVRQKLDLLQQFRDDLDAYDLEEDERDRFIKEFEDDLFAQTEENFDGNFKQV